MLRQFSRSLKAEVRSADDPATLWEHSAFDSVADLFLQRAALLARVQRNRAPDPLAGLKVDDNDLAALLGELPGLEIGDIAAAGEVEARLSGPLVRARAELAELFNGKSAFADLVRSAALSGLEAEVLTVLCAVEADPRRQRLVGYLNDDVTQRHLTLWSLGALFDRSEALVVAVGPSGGLRRAALLAQPTDAPWSAMPIVVPAPVLWWLGGDRTLDTALPPGARLVSGPGHGSAPLVVCAGPDRSRRIDGALSALSCERAIVSGIPTEAGQWDALIRQATLLGAGVVLEVEDVLSAEARDRVERAEHLCWAVTSVFDLPLQALFRKNWTEVTPEPPVATNEEWVAHFPTYDRAADLSGANYRLTAEQLSDVQRAAIATGGDVPAAVRRLAAGHIDATATRIRPSRTWDDLILDDSRLAQVREIAVRHRQRDVVFGEWGFSSYPSTGVIALFAGPSGTGKTLAAEVIAGELGVDLYKIDLANLVSKYIGETEKNLARVFEAAEASRVVLFFDEADALLGKRSEVSDAHDRYANIEVAYLLQRLESYEGVAVLATNLANNLDQAFLRRLHIVIEFSQPEPAERHRIWQRSIPGAAPLADDVDLERLASQIEITGGTIRNVAIRAAFLAAEQGSAITRDCLLTALQREFEKMGRLATSSDWERVFERRR